MGNFNSFVRPPALAGLVLLSVGYALLSPVPAGATPEADEQSFTIPPDAAPAPEPQAEPEAPAPSAAEPESAPEPEPEPEAPAPEPEPETPALEPEPEPEAPATEPAIMTAPAEVTPPPAAEPEPLTLKETIPLRYVVKRGDTLWDIASHYLEDPWQWPELWYANPQVQNPHLIYPGDVLQLVWKDGRPRLQRQAPEPEPEAAPPVVAEAGDEIARLRPQVREVPLAAAIPAIPIEALRNFLRGPRIVGRKELERAPFIVEFADEHMMSAAGNLVYVKNLPTGADYTYTVVRQGDAYRDPDDGALLGYEAIPVAEAELRQAGRPAVMFLATSWREAVIGDRLLPTEAELLQANFYPHAPVTPVGGRIVSVFNGVSQIGQFQVVTLNRGSQHGLEPGHVLSIMQAGRMVRDPYGKTSESTERLPDLYAGTLMVFKVSPRVGYALVMKAVRSIHVLDKVEMPQSTQRH